MNKVLRSLRAQLGVIFLGFLVLVGGSVVATLRAVQTQAADATVINLAGRQRMLTQKMTWLALAQPGGEELAAAAQLFGDTLHALRDGGLAIDGAGRTVTLPPAGTPAIHAQLDETLITWAAFRTHLLAGDLAAVEAASPDILAQLDWVVNAMENHSRAKLLRLQLIQSVFFVAAVLLLSWGYAVTRRRIVQPVAALGLAAQHIAEGQLDKVLPALADDELGDLARAFEAMRSEIAAARSQLESRVAQRTGELTTAFEFSQEIVAQLNLDHLLKSVTDRARTLTRAQAASLCLLDDSGEYVELAASSGQAVQPSAQRQPVKSGFVAHVIGAGETAAESACATCGYLRGQGPGQCAATPLRAGNQTLGALCVVRGNGLRFDADETRALSLLANSAAVAIANARLAEAGRRQAEESATLAERERVAGELHDNLAQTLSFLNLATDRLGDLLAAGQVAAAQAELQRLRPAIAAAYRQVRAALVGLREPAHGPDDLRAKLEACLEDFKRTTGLGGKLIVRDAAALELPPLVKTQVLHIAREALTNTRRHAHARQVWLRAEIAGDAARFTVEDDGRGFDPKSAISDNHLGLAIMQARAERSGGRLAIDTAPGRGTRIVVSFPLAAVDGPAPRLEATS